ncbi:unnamed protein product [Didymodactylos carnosus]|uniref:SUN domain-containing protein n=1 Tax=Didymodactylos carnosus TaxID=1234261 RepID=A0A814CQH8_9BILA|nr:unnamed protein product [Didymodactylos carnosus]CAF3720261.1 unnamed protein product [Didymodactylos carnosus]
MVLICSYNRCFVKSTQLITIIYILLYVIKLISADNEINVNNNEKLVLENSSSIPVDEQSNEDNHVLNLTTTINHEDEITNISNNPLSPDKEELTVIDSNADSLPLIEEAERTIIKNLANTIHSTDETIENASPIQKEQTVQTTSVIEEEFTSTTTTATSEEHQQNVNTSTLSKKKPVSLIMTISLMITYCYVVLKEVDGQAPSDISASLQATLTSSQATKKSKLRKNFASSSCGAKILANNPESSNTASILFSSPDEYMLNPCNAKIWFVLELCESIRILNIEIANFELFSSVPKTVRVSASDRYPTKDWQRYQLGTFNCTFNRTIQSFQTAQFNTYLKYVRFELVDFYGREHFCPLSIVRVHDEIMTMEENNGLVDKREEITKHLADLDDDSNDEQQPSSVIGSAIIDLAKKVFNLHHPTQQEQSSTINPILSSTTTRPLLPAELDPLKNSNYNKCNSVSSTRNVTNKKYSLLSFLKQCVSLLFGREINSCIEPIVFCSLHNTCCQCYINNTQFNNSNLTTPNLLSHQCGYYYLLTIRHSLNKQVNTSYSSQKTMINLNEFNVQNKTNLTNNTSSTLVHNLKANDNSTKNVTLTNNAQENVQDVLTSTNAPPSEDSILSDSPLINDYHHPNTTIVEPLLSILPSVPLNTSNDLNIDTEYLDDSLRSNISNSIIETVNVTISTLINDTELSTLSRSSSSVINGESIPSTVVSPWLKGLLMNTKTLPELLKIIEKLNFNLTLSNRYLEELSQHYLKKLDETQLVIDLLSIASKAADEKLKEYGKNIEEFQHSHTILNDKILKIEYSTIVIVFILVFMFLWCVFCTYRLIRLQRIIDVHLSLIDINNQSKIG